MANRLQFETSPYLLQHAHNPVDWYPWGEEAFARARRENKPILLSVGYSACHWCHVMERESFENVEIAGQMNEAFVCIKVDREERPDVDQIYMTAVQSMTGHGGWPMTVFLTPEGEPFYGGTYYPPVDSRGMPGFPRVLSAISDAYRSRTAEIVSDAKRLTEHIRDSQRMEGSPSLLTPSLLDGVLKPLLDNFDHEDGGFGGAPKFPQAMIIDTLQRTFLRTGDRRPLDMAELTLRKMAEGGMYDQLGGGFHRYSTDAVWLVPHFEKMLYDNALLARAYLHAHQLNGGRSFRTIVEETLDYLVREMTSPEGGFYSAQDADSEGEEGKFFVWSGDEVYQILGSDAELFARRYDVTPIGNFDGQSILHVAEPLDSLAPAFRRSADDIAKSLGDSRRKLFEVREKRVKPGRDDKILTSWNGLAIAAFADAGAALDRPDYLAVAEKSARFILEHMRDGDRLLRTYKDGRAHIGAFLEDYAALADGLLELYRATGTIDWLEYAVSLADSMIGQFWDPGIDGFYDTGSDATDLITRPRDLLDNATPSGNSMAVDVLLKLASLTGESRYEEIAIKVLRALALAVVRAPSAFGRLHAALDFHLSRPREIAVILPEGGQRTENGILHELRSRWLPNAVIAIAAEGAVGNPGPASALLEGKALLDGKPTAYVCRNFACQRPTTDPAELVRQLLTA